jgi:hypothetical protein
VRRAFVVVLALASLHLTGATRLLAALRQADRTQPPFVLVDLEPARRLLLTRGVRRAYASYGPAYRLTYGSAQRIVASQPWNERFLHHPLPFLDEVRFAKDVAWVLTPTVPSELPAPQAFETALGALGGRFRRTQAGEAVVYHDFEPPYGPDVEALPGGGPAGDLDLATALTLDSASPWTVELHPPRALAAITLLAPPHGPRLLRSMDVEVRGAGGDFVRVAERRRRDERHDLRWVNGHPQYVLDHDLVAVPLGGRVVSAIRVTPVASGDDWSLAECLLHPAGPAGPWDEWLDPRLGWSERRAALHASPRPTREDWHWRVLLAARCRGTGYVCR